MMGTSCLSFRGMSLISGKVNSGTVLDSLWSTCGLSVLPSRYAKFLHFGLVWFGFDPLINSLYVVN